MNACYLDCFSGASGDKLVASFLDLGMPVEYLHEQLSAMRLGNYDVEVETVSLAGISATRMNVRVTDVHVVRTWASVRELLESSDLADPVRERALGIFYELAQAEAKVHGKPVDLVHFHEVGAVDSIVDVVGSAAALEFFGLEKVLASPVALGSGMVRSEHGTLPVPAPATVEILRDVPVYSGGVTGELTTPTGAAVLKHSVDEFGDMPLMELHGVGYGAGSHDLDVPNVLRVLYGELVSDRPAGDRIVVIETTIDNTSPQVLGAVFDMLLEAGALDVWTTSVQMKKQRSGVVVTVLADPGSAPALQDILLKETDTIGLRIREDSRVCLPRAIERVQTSLGEVGVKVARLGDRVASVMPEFDEVKQLAKEKGLPVKTAFDRVKREAEEELGAPGDSD